MARFGQLLKKGEREEEEEEEKREEERERETPPLTSQLHCDHPDSGKCKRAHNL